MDESTAIYLLFGTAGHPGRHGGYPVGPHLGYQSP